VPNKPQEDLKETGHHLSPFYYPVDKPPTEYVEPEYTV
jgi:hypothetical protein